MRNRAKDINQQLLVLNIEHLQQETQAVCDSSPHEGFLSPGNGGDLSKTHWPTESKRRGDKDHWTG